MVQPARFQSLQTEMEGRLFERREEIEGLILAVLSRQHILLVGPKGAATELPQEEALSALYDRFLLRYRVEYIAEDGHLVEMMADNRPPVLTTRITLDEIHAAREAVAAVEFDRPLLESIAKIRRRLEGEGLTLSDRRYKESLSIIRAKAWLQGRAYAVEDDLAVLANVLWDDPASEPMVPGLVLDVSNPHDNRARAILDALQVALTTLPGLDHPPARTRAPAEFLSIPLYA